MSERARPAPPDPDRVEEPSRSRSWRLLHLLLGWLFFAIGIIGVLLPLLPTTPFMLLALWSFSRSSQRFHDWLYRHRIFGPRLQAWRHGRVIPLPVKLTAYVAMLVSFAMMALIARIAWPALVGAGLVMGFGAIYIGRCPSKPTDDRETTAPTSLK